MITQGGGGSDHIVEETERWLAVFNMNGRSGKRKIRPMANVTFQNKTRVRVSEGGATQL